MATVTEMCGVMKGKEEETHKYVQSIIAQANRQRFRSECPCIDDDGGEGEKGKGEKSGEERGDNMRRRALTQTMLVTAQLERDYL